MKLALPARILGLAFAAAVVAPGAHADTPVVVSSKIDTEGNLLGNVIAQVLKAHGIPVTEKIALGTTPIMRKALTSGWKKATGKEPWLASAREGLEAIDMELDFRMKTTTESAAAEPGSEG